MYTSPVNAAALLKTSRSFAVVRALRCVVHEFFLVLFHINLHLFGGISVLAPVLCIFFILQLQINVVLLTVTYLLHVIRKLKRGTVNIRQ